jgi:hypothetical protein
MPHNQLGQRIPPPSLLRAADDLARTSGESAGPQWGAEAFAALRATIRAVEAELGDLSAAAGLGREIAVAEPRLIHALGRLEADLRWTLVALWTMKDRMSRGQGNGDLSHLSRHISRTAERVFQLLNESLDDPAAMD